MSRGVHWLPAICLAALFYGASGVYAGEGGSGFFASPRIAVDQISHWLRAGDFRKLTNHYDLRCAGTDKKEMYSGRYFIQERHQGPGDPHLWKYRRPFAPGFQYAGLEAIEGTRIFRVELRITIPQGTGSPDQVGLDEFYLVLRSQGWQAVPKAYAREVDWCDAYRLAGSHSQ